MIISLNLNEKTELCQIMSKFGSDKGSGWHNYTKVYHYLFSGIRQNNVRVFELGLGTNNEALPSSMGVNGKPCASVYGWEEYFPNAQIFGADIDKNILFSSQRIKTFFCDQTDSKSIEALWGLDDLKENFDIIIEDGLHTVPAQINFLENSFHKLKNGGYYICEDIALHTIPAFQSYLKNSYFALHKHQIFDIPNIQNRYDNVLLIIKKNES